MKKFVAAIALASLASLACGQDRCVSIVDGTVTLNGSFSKLAGLDINSVGGYLSRGPGEIDGLTIPGQGHAPWPFGVPSFLANTPHQIAYGVLGADKVIDIEGETKTAALYSETQDVAKTDLTVFGGVDGNAGVGGGAGQTCAVVPEPATGLMAAFGLLGLLGSRGRRSSSDLRLTKRRVLRLD